MRRPSLRLVMLLIFGLTTIVFLTLSNVLTSHFVSRTFETELKSYAESQTLVFAMMVEQDLVNGFYPAIAQKAEKLLARDEILRIKITQADGTTVVDEAKPIFTGKEAKSIVIQESVGSPAPGTPAGTVTLWLDGTRAETAVAEMGTMIATVGFGVLVLLCGIILVTTTWLSRPLARLRQVATSGDLSQIAGIIPLSGIAEIRDLETQLQELGRQALDQAKVGEENARLQAMARTTQMLAHDVRRPFSKLKISVQMLLRSKSHADVLGAAQRILPDVERDIASVNGLIQDIMEFGSAGAMQVEEVSLKALLQETMQETLDILRPVGLEVSAKLENSRRIRVDALKIRRVLANLLDNAVHAAGRGGRLWLESRDVGGEVEFTVGNTGATIPESEAELVFQAFYTKNKQGGTGLGLAIAQKIVLQHGGRVVCRSSSERGTEFVVVLPAANSLDGEVASFPQGRSQEVPSSSRLVRRTGLPLVAVVEDDPFISSAWVDSLQSAFDVVTYEKPSDFWVAVRTRQLEPSDLLGIVTDYHFPNDEVHGVTFAREVLAKWSLPVCMSTDAVLEAETTAGLQQIGKTPLSADELRAAFAGQKARQQL